MCQSLGHVGLLFVSAKISWHELTMYMEIAVIKSDFWKYIKDWFSWFLRYLRFILFLTDRFPQLIVWILIKIFYGPKLCCTLYTILEAKLQLLFFDIDTDIRLSFSRVLDFLETPLNNENIEVLFTWQWNYTHKVKCMTHNIWRMAHAS